MKLFNYHDLKWKLWEILWPCTVTIWEILIRVAIISTNNHIINFVIWLLSPELDQHLHLAGPRLSHASFTTRFSCPHLCENSFLLGINILVTPMCFNTLVTCKKSCHDGNPVNFSSMLKVLHWRSLGRSVNLGCWRTHFIANHIAPFP